MECMPDLRGSGGRWASSICSANALPTAPRIEEMRPRDALLEQVQNTYMNWLPDRERRAEEFDALWKVVQQVPVRRIVAHTDGAAIGKLCEIITADATQILAQS